MSQASPIVHGDTSFYQHNEYEPPLATKLYVPPTRSDQVARPRLTARITEGVRRSLTLVTAPAGWGKTTVLSEWHATLRGNNFPVAWVSLDAGDNDPVRFWTYVIAALNTLHLGVARQR